MALPPPQTREFAERIVVLEDDCRRELDQSIQSLHEISMLLTKTNSEVEKLSNRELQFSNRVRDMEMHLDNYTREDIRDLYTTSHEIQLRLFMMRSQAEQLQNRQQHIKEYQQKLAILLDLLAIQEVPTDGTGSLVGKRQTGMLATPGGTEMIGGPSFLSIIEAQEEERLRVSRQIHDGPTQSLTNLILRAEICERLIDRDINEARAEIHSLKAMINNSLQDTRRMIFDLRPMILDDLGLVPTLRRYLTELGRLKQVHGQVSGAEHDLHLNTTMQVALFRFVQIILGAILAEGGVDHMDIEIIRDEETATIRIEVSGMQTERAVVEERLQDPHLQQRLTMLSADLIAEQRSSRGLSIDVIVPVPVEATL